MENHASSTSKLLFVGFLILMLLLDTGSALASSKYIWPTRNGIRARSFQSCLTASGVRNFSVTGSPSYAGLLNFSIQNLQFTLPRYRKPDAVVLPTSLHGLQRAVLCARGASLAVRVRSGGHSSEGQSYTVSGGAPDGRAVVDYPFVVIDLMNLNEVRVHATSATAWVESGSTLGEVYHAVAARSSSSSPLAFTGGTCPTVGVGGHVSGGGFGMLSRKFMLAADNALDAILVDAKGRIMDRRAMGEDVFWAIRGGGGGSWGVVYAWKLRLVPVPKTVTVFTLTRNGTKSSMAELVYRWQLVGPNLPDEFYLSVNLTIGGPVTLQQEDAIISVSFTGLVLGPQELAMSMLRERFPELGLTVSEMSEMSWIESVARLAGLTSVNELTSRVSNTKHYFKHKSDYVRQPVPKEALLGLLRMLAAGPPGSFVSLDPYGGAMARLSPGDTPFPHRAGNLYSIQYTVTWAADVDPVAQWLVSLYYYMSPYVSRNPRRAYVNYLDMDLDPRSGEASGAVNRSLSAVDRARVTWGAAYFTVENYDRLVRVKTLIDPDNVFNQAQSIPPLPKQG